MSTAAPLPEPLRTGKVPLPTLEQLPDDRMTLKHMVLELLASKRCDRRELDDLRHRLDLLLRRLYGPRTERFNPDQLLLFDEPADDQANQPPAEAAPPASAEPASPQRRQARPHGRRPLPADLPRRPVHHELTEAERLCSCGHLRVDIGAEPREQLDWQPASFFVWQHWIHKYLCPHCAKLTTTAADITEPASTEATGAADLPTAATPAEALAPKDMTSTSSTESIALVPGSPGPVIISAVKPAMPIAKGLPGPGLLAQVIVSKYADHLPLYRQENITARQGVLLPRSTTCDWMAASANLLRPLYDLMVANVLLSRWLHTDDTSVKNLGHEPDTTATARFWVYIGDRNHPYNVFDFTLNRKRDGPQQFLKDYRGYLHADAFSGYDALYLPGPRAGEVAIIESACNAHARRKFHDAQGSDGLRAHRALAYYAQLYALEERAKANHFDDAARLQLRQELAVPILTKFLAWLEEQRPLVLPKSPMAEAIGYALNNWTALCRYTERGFLEIDNNIAEREMKRIATGRKNWLFVGSANGGRTAAVLFSFTFTCQRLAINPWAYLQDVLARLPELPASQLGELLPDRWQAARQQVAAAPAGLTDTVPVPAQMPGKKV